MQFFICCGLVCHCSYRMECRPCAHFANICQVSCVRHFVSAGLVTHKGQHFQLCVGCVYNPGPHPYGDLHMVIRSNGWYQGLTSPTGFLSIRFQLGRLLWVATPSARLHTGNLPMSRDYSMFYSEASNRASKLFLLVDCNGNVGLHLEKISSII